MEERKIGAFTKRVAFKEKPARQDHRPSNLPVFHLSIRRRFRYTAG